MFGHLDIVNIDKGLAGDIRPSPEGRNSSQNIIGFVSSLAPLTGVEDVAPAAQIGGALSKQKLQKKRQVISARHAERRIRRAREGISDMSKNVRINPPSSPANADAYLEECQFALEPSVYGLMKLAVAAGWEPKQAATAIAVLSVQIARKEMEAKVDD